MQINTKYNVGDEVWVMVHNKPEKLKVSLVMTESNLPNRFWVGYMLTGAYVERNIELKLKDTTLAQLATTTGEYAVIYEEHIHATRQELVESLLT